MYEWMTSQQKQIFLILLAVNQQYFPTYKWMYQTMENMPVKPSDIVKRFREAFRRPMSEAIEDANKIIEETMSLVAGHFPEIDFDVLRRRHFKERKVFEKVVL